MVDIYLLIALRCIHAVLAGRPRAPRRRVPAPGRPPAPLRYIPILDIGYWISIYTYNLQKHISAPSRPQPDFIEWKTTSVCCKN